MARPERYFCTAGRGMEPFAAREVRARLGATEVDYVSGKVFFTTRAELCDLRKLKSGERLFLLLRRRAPLHLSRNKGKALHEIKSLVTEEPRNWLDIISIWKNLCEHKEEKDDVSQENPLPLKRKPEEEVNIAAKRQKTDTVSEECQAGAEKSCLVTKSDQDFGTESQTSREEPSQSSEEKDVDNEKHSFSFRVSCRCSGAIAKILTSQEIGRAIGIALMKQFGWRADLRNPDLEIFVHLNDIHSVLGIPLFRIPLANREYIQTAGLRSTIAWAMASLAEIRAGAFVLDPMCGLGTILLEAAKEWPEACYWGADISDSQLEGAYTNIRSADLMDKIELLKASVKALPLPSESFDTVISDIPFGKKFKITKDVPYLPDILQEMERCFCLKGSPFCKVTLQLDIDLTYRVAGIWEEAGEGGGVVPEYQGNLRVLRVGGSLVLLLGQDLRKDMDEVMKRVESDGSPKAVSDGTNETTTVKTSDVNGNSSSAVPGVEESFLGSRQMCFGSLVLDGVYGVSLGKTDAFIHKYKKISTAGNQ